MAKEQRSARAVNFSDNLSDRCSAVTVAFQPALDEHLFHRAV